MSPCATVQACEPVGADTAGRLAALKHRVAASLADSTPALTEAEADARLNAVMAAATDTAP